jgi:uncharacterized membrane protein
MNEDLSRTEAQQRVDDIHVFRRELARLEGEHVLALDDGRRSAVRAHHDALLAQLSARHDVDTNIRSRQLSLGLRIASFLGALALAASVFFLFNQFWAMFAEPVQVAVLLSASLLSLLVTVWLHGREGAGYFTKLAAMVAFACFVLNLALLGDTFNITPSDKALLPWAAFAFLLAYCCDLRLLLVAGLLCVTGFIAARVGAWGGMYWLSVGERPENFFPAALAMFAMPWLISHRRHPGFDATYRLTALLALFLPMLVLGHWGEGSYLALDADTVEVIYQLLGFIAGAALAWAGARQGWPEVMNTAVVFFVIFLYTKFFDWWWVMMPKYLFFMVLGLSALLVIMVLKRLRAAAARQGALR